MTKTLYPDWIRVWISIQSKMLDPDSCVADPKLLFWIRYRIRIRPFVSFGSGFGSGFESRIRIRIRIRIQILDFNPDQKKAKTSFSETKKQIEEVGTAFL